MTNEGEDSASVGGLSASVLALSQELFDIVCSRAGAAVSTDESASVAPSRLRAKLLVIGVAGESGSGKSSAAEGLTHVARASGLRAVMLSSDNYFVLPPRTNHEHRCESLAHVGPHEVNMALLATHVAAFHAAERDVTAPLVDYAGNRFVTQQFDFSSADLLVVEGTYVLMLDGIDVGIFFEATHRDNEERRRLRSRDIDAPIIADILEIEHTIIAPQLAVADIVVDAAFRIVRGQ